MKLPRVWSVVALLPLAGGLVLAQDGRKDSSRALVPVEPAPLERELSPDPLDRIFARDFDRADWTARLTDVDLDAREGAFSDLVRRARLDPLARAFVEELAAGALDHELRWTARLALREIGRAGFPVVDPFDLQPGSPGGLEALLEELRSEFPGMDFFTGPRQGRWRIAPGTQQPLGLEFGSGKSVQIQSTPGGAKVVIKETVDGNEETREYTGESLQAILDENPELEDEVKVHVLQPGQPGQPGMGGRRFLGLLHPHEYGQLAPEAPGEWRSTDALERALSPAEKSRPSRTDVLGVIAKPIGAARAEVLGLEHGTGLVVTSVASGSFAHLLGVAKDDVLLELNEADLHRVEDITRVMESRGAKDELRLVWMDALGQRHERTWPPARRSGG